MSPSLKKYIIRPQPNSASSKEGEMSSVAISPLSLEAGHKELLASEKKEKVEGAFGGSLAESRALYDEEVAASDEALSKILEERRRPYSWWWLLYAFLGPLFTFAMVYVSFVLWPMQNVFSHPHTWWNCMLKCGTVMTSLMALTTLTFAGAWLNVKSILAFDNFLWTFFICSGALAIGWLVFKSLPLLTLFFRTLEWVVWNFLLNLPSPVPFSPFGPTSLCFLAISLTIFYMFPASWRSEPTFARQLRWLVAAQLYMAAHMVSNFLLFNFIFFIILPPYLQWLAAFGLPGIRELSSFVLTAICKRVAGGKEDMKATLVIASFLDTFHALFLAISVGSLANVVTTWTFFGVDFVFNAYALFKIYRASRNGLINIGEDILGIVQGMFLGFAVSLVYLASLVVIYNGPNADVLGNIKNSYFDYQAIEDLEGTIKSILLIVAIETLTSVATIAILQLKCRISIGLTFLHLMKEFGLIIMAQMLYWFFIFFCLLESKFQHI